MSEHVVKGMVKALLNLASEPSNRGIMVQQGALRVLGSLFENKDQTVREQSAVAIARIAITTNPHCFPQEGVVFSLVRPLLYVIKNSNKELHQFEVTPLLSPSIPPNLYLLFPLPGCVGPNMINSPIHSA